VSGDERRHLVVRDPRAQCRVGRRGDALDVWPGDREDLGKAGGGVSFGYRIVRRLENGVVSTGEREIVPDEASIVRRIFNDYRVVLVPPRWKASRSSSRFAPLRPARCSQTVASRNQPSHTHSAVSPISRMEVAFDLSRSAVTGKIATVPIAMRLVLWMSAAIAAGCAGSAPHLRLATTTSVDNSGLLQAILPSFRQETGIDVQVLAVGSGRALQLLRRADADVALTHDPLTEAALLKEMPAAGYRKIMFNDFVVVGPALDEASVRQSASAADAMRRIATSTAFFVSRGDESGTHARERQLWQKAGVKASADRLLETGQSMAATLRMASERHAYTLTDRATFTQLAHALAVQPLFEHDPDLLNTYAVIVPNVAERGLAMQFMTWLSDGGGRARIASFTIDGTRPFIIWPAGLSRDTPDALPQ
jgi:tungstate transport system substrate-binding protein